MLIWRNLYKSPSIHCHLKRSLAIRMQSNSARMQKLYVRHVPDEERMQITLDYGVKLDSGLEIPNRTYNLSRLQTEEHKRTLERLGTNIMGVISKSTFKKKKKAKSEVEKQQMEEDVKAVERLTGGIFVSSADTGNHIEDTVPNSEVWVDGNHLVIGDTKYSVVVNSPTVLKAKLPSSIMSGFPVYPKLDVEFTDLSKSTFTWFGKAKESPVEGGVTEDEKQGEAAAENPSSSKRAKKDPGSKETPWEELHVGFHFIPSNADIGKQLKITCVPSNGQHEGRCSSFESEDVVSAGPGQCPFEKRHALTEKPAGEHCFRFVSYNILADVYADSDYTREYLFPHCPPYALTIDYRKQLLLKEIIGYNADIVCLQEVDKKVFLGDLLPVLDLEGLDGVLKQKNGDLGEGGATFFRRSKFRLLSQHDIDLTQTLASQKMCKDLLEKVTSNDLLEKKMMERKTSLQVSILESREDPHKKVLVANTHLYFHPRANHIRILQSVICMRHIQSVVQHCESQGFRPSIIFCGDLNSSPITGVHSFLAKKHIPAHHADWYIGGKMEFVDGMTFSHEYDLESACGHPTYTNYVSGFCGCIDYIYTEKDRLKTTQVVPLPSHEEVTQYTALPNVVFPSDHMALVCDLTWTDVEKEMDVDT